MIVVKSFLKCDRYIWFSLFSSHNVNWPNLTFFQHVKLDSFVFHFRFEIEDKDIIVYTQVVLDAFAIPKLRRNQK